MAVKVVTLNSSPDINREALLAGSRRDLARAITLLESTRPQDRDATDALITALPLPQKPTLRLGLTGTPGVGKSTFVERYGLQLCDQGHRVAVIAVDPSSARSGGAILGDKTRMPDLSRHPNAYIRPSASGLEPGGVARATRDIIQLVEATGFDRVIVETVGVGQSETLVAEMTDIFLLLMAPGGGDELQGVKRGIMEIADLVLVNKADGDLAATANRTCADYAGALRLLRKRDRDPDAFPRAMTASALTGFGFEDIHDAVAELANWRAGTGRMVARRRQQDLSWFGREIDRQWLLHIGQDPGVAACRTALEDQIREGRISARAALSDFRRDGFGLSAKGGG